MTTGLVHDWSTQLTISSLHYVAAGVSNLNSLVTIVNDCTRDNWEGALEPQEVHCDDITTAFCGTLSTSHTLPHARNFSNVTKANHPAIKSSRLNLADQADPRTNFVWMARLPSLRIARVTAQTRSHEDSFTKPRVEVRSDHHQKPRPS